MANVEKEITAVKNNGKKMSIDDKISLKELEEQYQKMIEDRDKKCKAAKEQLVEMLKVTVDKYRTATGTAEALRTLRFVIGDDSVNPTWANKLAWDMSVEASKMSQKAEGLGYAEMDKLCDGFYEQEFQVTAEQNEFQELAFEMMRIDLCRNVGGAAEDMVSFINRVQEELDEISKAIEDLKSGKDE